MKHVNHLIKFTILGILAAVLFSGCGSTTGGGDDDVSAGAVEIPADKNTITFAVTSGQYSDVAFTHKTHSSQYMNDECMTCHAHSGVRDNTIWNCNACHTPDATGPDDQNCSDPNEPGHACWMVQCENCHTSLASDPTPDCADCHSTVNVGAFIDSAVEGVYFFTSTRSGLTNNNGAFSYQPGEQAVTFSLGDIVIGTGIPKSIMTPIDLVPGAVAETNQTVTNIARLLQTLDEDGDHSNGIRIPITVFQYAQNRSINFNVDPNDFWTSNPDLQSLLADLNASGVFTDGAHTLVDAAAAQINLRTALDSLSSGCRISAIQSSPLTFTGTYEPNAGQSFSYQWYRDGSLINGATSETYSPGAADYGSYLTLEVAFDGNQYACKAVVPHSSNSVTVYGEINTPAEVDHLTLSLNTAANVTIDVESYEAEKYSLPDWYHGPTQTSDCFSCHHHMSSSDQPGPDDFFGNGRCRDRLITNIYLFQDDPTTGSLIDFRDCLPSACGYNSGCYPGCDAPGAGTTRNENNPFLNRTGSDLLVSGDYFIKIGAANLSEDDARASNNRDGTYKYPGGFYEYSEYRMTLTFTQ